MKAFILVFICWGLLLLVASSSATCENLNQQRNTEQLQNNKQHLEELKRDLESQKDNTTTDHCGDWECALIGGGAGAVVVSISFAMLYIYNKLKQPRHQDVEQGGDEREPLLATMNQAIRENRRLSREVTETETENERTNENSKLRQNKQLLDTLTEVKDLLENQKDHLAQRLQDVKTKREKNKEELQSVEKTITEREIDDKELLLGQKEELLQSQWKLDEEKKNYERQLLNIEKVLEPIEIQMTRLM